jgi:hypothetical protein
MFELYDVKNKIILAENEKLSIIYLIKSRCFRHYKTIIREQKWNTLQ